MFEVLLTKYYQEMTEDVFFSSKFDLRIIFYYSYQCSRKIASCSLKNAEKWKGLLIINIKIEILWLQDKQCFVIRIITALRILSNTDSHCLKSLKFLLAVDKKRRVSSNENKYAEFGWQVQPVAVRWGYMYVC